MSKKRFALLLGLFLLALFPNSGPPAVAAPRASGEIAAHEVTFSLPAVNAPLTRQGGGTAEGAAVGQTGGDTLLFSSPTIAAGQLFDRVGVHWVAARGTQDTLYVELRTSRSTTRATPSTACGSPMGTPLMSSASVSPSWT